MPFRPCHPKSLISHALRTLPAIRTCCTYLVDSCSNTLTTLTTTTAPSAVFIQPCTPKYSSVSDSEGQVVLKQRFPGIGKCQAFQFTPTDGFMAGMTSNNETTNSPAPNRVWPPSKDGLIILFNNDKLRCGDVLHVRIGATTEKFGGENTIHDDDNAIIAKVELLRRVKGTKKYEWRMVVPELLGEKAEPLVSGGPQDFVTEMGRLGLVGPKKNGWSNLVTVHRRGKNLGTIQHLKEELKSALPTFTPTSSPELDTLLSTFRTNVFLPSHLITAQRSLLYRPKNHGLLTNPDEPATVKVGGEVLQLHPLNHLRDEPPTNQSIAKVLELMKEGKDWANLPGFLEGLRTAKRKMKAAQLEKLVRRANGCGRQGVVLVCLQRVERTGLGLWDGPVARECMLGAVMRGMEGAWETEAVEDAARLARAYWELMWDDRHSKARGANVKLMPEVVGIMVLLSAARLLKGGETKEELEKFGQRLLGLGGKMDFTVDEQDWVQANHKLVAWAPVSQGMQLARKALGEESQLGRELGVMAQKDLEPMLRKALAAVYEHTPEDGSRRGAKLYGDLAQANL